MSKTADRFVDWLRGINLLECVAVSASLLIVLIVWLAQIPPFGAFHLDQLGKFTIALTALRPLVVISAMIVGATLLLASFSFKRLRSSAVILLLLTAPALLQIAPRWLGSQNHDAQPGSITILALNGNESKFDTAQLVQLATQIKADAVAVSETKADLAADLSEQLKAVTNEQWIVRSDNPPERDYDPHGAWTTSLLVKRSLKPQALPIPPHQPNDHGQVRFELAGTTTPLSLAAIHAVSPTSGWDGYKPQDATKQWRRDISSYSQLCARNTVLVGDFNATLDHSPMRGLLNVGCKDAASQTGNGLSSTWQGGPRQLIRLPIDHVLVPKGWKALSTGNQPITGSDHKAVWARIVPES